MQSNGLWGWRGCRAECVFNSIFVLFLCTVWSPEVIKSLEALIHQCLGDRIPLKEVRRIGSEFLGKRSPSHSIYSNNGTPSGSSQSVEPLDWMALCQGNEGRPVLKELCRWMAQDQSPLDDPIDCELIFDLDKQDDEDYPVSKRGLGAVLLSGKRMNRENRRVMGSEFLGKRALGSEFLGKRSMGSEFLGKRALGSEFLGKRALGSEFLGKRALGSEFLGKRALGSEFLGKRALGSEFLGKRALGSEFLGKRAYRHSAQPNVEAEESDQLHSYFNTNQFY